MQHKVFVPRRHVCPFSPPAERPRICGMLGLEKSLFLSIFQTGFGDISSYMYVYRDYTLAEYQKPIVPAHVTHECQAGDPIAKDRAGRCASLAGRRNFRGFVCNTE